MNHAGEIVAHLHEALEREETRLRETACEPWEPRTTSVRFYWEEWVHYLLARELHEKVLKTRQPWEFRLEHRAPNRQVSDLVVFEDGKPVERYEVKGPDYIDPAGMHRTEAGYFKDIKKQKNILGIEGIRCYVLWFLHGDPAGIDSWIKKAEQIAEPTYGLRVRRVSSGQFALNEIPANDRCRSGYVAEVIALGLDLPRIAASAPLLSKS